MFPPIVGMKCKATYKSFNKCTGFYIYSGREFITSQCKRPGCKVQVFRHNSNFLWIKSIFDFQYHSYKFHSISRKKKKKKNRSLKPVNDRKRDTKPFFLYQWARQCGAQNKAISEQCQNKVCRSVWYLQTSLHYPHFQHSVLSNKKPASPLSLTSSVFSLTYQSGTCQK